MVAPDSPKPFNILLADDGSQHAMSAVALLRDLLCDGRPRPNCRISAVSVYNPLHPSEQESLRTALEQSRAFLEEKSIPVTTELMLGYPAEKLIERADQTEPDLIVLGAKGLRATLGIWLGGVAQQVVEYAHWPVLIVRSPYSGLRRILLVTDGSRESQSAVAYLAGLGRRPPLPIPDHAELTVMHVLAPIVSAEAVARSMAIEPATFSSVPIEQVLESSQAWQVEEEARGQELIEKTLKTLRSAGREANGVLLRGDAATEIIDYVKEHHVDLVVAGSRGLSQVKAWLLGSVSRKLVHYAGCSVLIVRDA